MPAGGLANGTLQVALAEPLDPAKSDEIDFVAKRDVQIVVADPAEIGSAIERFYGQEENESFAEILKELGDDKTGAGSRRRRATTSMPPRSWRTRCPSSSS